MFASNSVRYRLKIIVATDAKDVAKRRDGRRFTGSRLIPRMKRECVASAACDAGRTSNEANKLLCSSVNDVGP